MGIQLYGRNTETGECGYFNLEAPADMTSCCTVDANMNGSVIEFTNSEGTVIYSVDILGALTDENTYSTVQQATEAGVDVAGNSYEAGDTLLVTPDGDVLSVVHTIDTDTDTFSMIATASGSGVDELGNSYDVGDMLLVQPDGKIYSISSVDTTSDSGDDVDTYAVASIATAPGIDSAGNAYNAADLLITLPDGTFFSVVQPVANDTSIPENCCVGQTVVITRPEGQLFYSGVCADPNIQPAGTVGSYLLDTTVSPYNIYRSDGNEWEIIPIGELLDSTYFYCVNTGTGYIFDDSDYSWTESDAPTTVNPDDPDTWGETDTPYAFQPVVDDSGCMLGFIDSTGGHPICCPIIDPLYINSDLEYGPQLSGLCGDPNAMAPAADGDYILDTSTTPHNLFVSDGSDWELIPRSEVQMYTSFECLNAGGTNYVFDPATMDWFQGPQPVLPVQDNPATWGQTVGCKVRFVIDSDGGIIGIVNNTGGVPISHPDSVAGDVGSSGDTPPGAGTEGVIYVQTNVSNPQTGQDDLNIIWYYDGTSWIRINDLIYRNATTSWRGIVELATNGEALAGVDTERAVTPAALAHVLATLDDLHAVGWDGYDPVNNILTLRMSDGTTHPVDLTALINDVISVLPIASETEQGIVELATIAEAIAGIDTERAVTPAGLQAAIDDALSGISTGADIETATAAGVDNIGNPIGIGDQVLVLENGKTINLTALMGTPTTPTSGFVCGLDNSTNKIEAIKYLNKASGGGALDNPGWNAPFNIGPLPQLLDGDLSTSPGASSAFNTGPTGFFGGGGYLKMKNGPQELCEILIFGLNGGPIGPMRHGGSSSEISGLVSFEAKLEGSATGASVPNHRSWDTVHSTVIGGNIFLREPFIIRVHAQQPYEYYLLKLRVHFRNTDFQFAINGRPDYSVVIAR